MTFCAYIDPFITIKYNRIYGIRSRTFSLYCKDDANSYTKKLKVEVVAKKVEPDLHFVYINKLWSDLRGGLHCILIREASGELAS